MPKKHSKKHPKGGKRGDGNRVPEKAPKSSKAAAPAVGSPVKDAETGDKPLLAKIETQAQSVAKIRNIVVEQHRYHGVFLARNKDDSVQLLTRNKATGDASEPEQDYEEHRFCADFRGLRCEFRTWSPFQSNLAAAIMSGVEDLYLKSGSKVLYLGAGLGLTVSHISDIIDKTGVVYAVEPGPWAVRPLSALSERRPNVVPILEDPSAPYKYYKQLTDKIDVIICNLQQAEQARILMLNARHFLKPNGHFAIFLYAESIYDKAPTKMALIAEMELLKKYHLEPLQLVQLDPYVRGNALVVGVYTRLPVL